MLSAADHERERCPGRKCPDQLPRDGSDVQLALSNSPLPDIVVDRMHLSVCGRYQRPSLAAGTPVDVGVDHPLTRRVVMFDLVDVTAFRKLPATANARSQRPEYRSPSASAAQSARVTVTYAPRGTRGRLPKRVDFFAPPQLQTAACGSAAGWVVTDTQRSRGRRPPWHRRASLLSVHVVNLRTSRLARLRRLVDAPQPCDQIGYLCIAEQSIRTLRS